MIVKTYWVRFGIFHHRESDKVVVNAMVWVFSLYKYKGLATNIKSNLFSWSTITLVNAKGCRIRGVLFTK